MLYRTSLDKHAIVFTVSVTVLFAFIILMQYPIITNHGRDGAYYTTITCFLIYCIAFAFRPISYYVNDSEILVQRPLYNVRIRKGDILKAEIVSKKEIGNCTRTFGIGGLFGYYGDFHNYSLGSMTWYATRKDKAVLLTTKTKAIVLTPDDAEAFVAHLAK